jgi:dipeptidyl aminopeptidase/acylaminoacyl peptidase
VSVAGISDLHTFTAWVAGQQRSPDNQGSRYLYRFLGAAGSDDPKLDEISPVKHVGAVRAPILLLHGTDDTVVPTEQSTEMADALKSAGKDVTFVTLSGEDHWLSRAETRTQALQAMVAFLEKNNPP